MSRSRKTGTAWESAVVNYLRDRGFTYAERRAMNGSQDRGDVTGLGPRWVIECKATKQITLAEFMKETEAERQNAGADYGVLVIKRPRASIEDAYCVLPLRELVALMKEAEGIA